MAEPTPSRNAPCPCGSGKKYKNCCMGKRVFSASSSGGSRRIWLLIAACAIIGLGAWAWTNRTETPPPVAPMESTGRTPQPYEYDPVNDRHWHAGHGHWHNGPPPIGLLAPETAPATAPAATPQPYEYDPAQNRHWDPDHGHWHNGPPPPRDPEP